MSEKPKKYQIIIYNASSVPKNDAAFEKLMNILSLEKEALRRRLKGKLIFAIRDLAKDRAGEIAGELREHDFEIDVELQGINNDHKSWLLSEGQKWIKRGLLFPGNMAKILENYDLEEEAASLQPARKEKDPKALIRSVLYIGAGLVGLGIILFIAANWAKIPPSAKIVGSTLLTLGFLHTGYQLKFGTKQKLDMAHTFFFLSAMGIGATVLLIGQIYHLQAESYILPLIWGALSLPVAFFMKVPSLIFLTGGLWLLSHFNYHNSHHSYLWTYLPLQLGILIPYSLKLERKDLLYFNLAGLMLSAFLATLDRAHWANLIIAACLVILFLFTKRQSLLPLSFVAFAFWNIAFISNYQTFPNLFYLLPLGYFFWMAYKSKLQEFMLLNVVNVVFFLIGLFYQFEERFDLPSPEGTDILLFLTAVSLCIYTIGRYLETKSEWRSFLKYCKAGGVIFGLLFIYILSFHFYDNQDEMFVSPIYFYATLAFLGIGISFFLMRIGERSPDWQEIISLSLVAISIISGFLVAANSLWYVIIFNVILFTTAFSLMLHGYHTSQLPLYNGSVALFIVIIVTRYFDTLWQLLPRSLFFIIGGVFLITWAFFIDKRRRRIIEKLKEVNP